FRQWNLGGSNVTRTVRETGEGQGVVSAAALMIQTQRVSASEGAGGPIVNEESIGYAQARHLQPILARSFELSEICFQHVLVTGVGETFIRPGGEPALIDRVAAGQIDQRKARGSDLELSQAAQVIPDHRFLRRRRAMNNLIHIDGGAP